MNTTRKASIDAATMSRGFIALALCSLSLAACKPKVSGSDLQTITGLNAQGQEAALSLVPVRNFSVAKLAGNSDDAGVRQAEAMAKARLFALVECVEVKSKDGVRISPAELMSAVEMRAAIDDLYLDDARQLLTSADDDRLAKFGSQENKLIVVPCHVHGRRLLSWDAAMDIQLRALGLPKALPSDETARGQALKTYRAVQALHLSLRGSYAKKAKDTFMPRLPSMIDMMREQAGFDADVAALAGRIRKADAFYNPCDSRDTSQSSLPYADGLRELNYGCEAHPRLADAFNYRAGAGKASNSSQKFSYETVKNDIALEIEATHAAIFFSDDDHDKALFLLWDLLTSGESWTSRQGDAKDLAGYLTTGKGFDFADTFESRASGANAAPASAPNLSPVDKVAAPLVAFVSSNESRAKLIRRATSQSSAGRSVLDGGQTTTAEGLPATAKARVSLLGKSMGPAGSVKLPELGNAISSALSLMRSVD